MQFRRNHYIAHPKKEMEHRLNRMVQRNISTANLHLKTFTPFKAKHIGQNIVIYATGPSAKDYIPIENAVHIGVNRAFATCPVPLDYTFLEDYSGSTKEYIADLNVYRPETCQKFYGLVMEHDYRKKITIPESEAIKANALRYRIDVSAIPYEKSQFAYDIATQPLADFYSIVFPALQFALWTYPRRIYLVGCDCSSSGYVSNPNAKNTNKSKIIPYYQEFKKFSEKYYPDVEIVSINPVGLKGVFKDLYQKNAH